MSIFLGTFEVTSGKIIISDPCYKLPKNSDKNKINEIIDVPNGTWSAYVFKYRNGNNVSELMILHESITLKDINDVWLDHLTKICVDSGQAGFFDLKYYKDDDNVQNHELAPFIGIESKGDKWYSMCCDKTYNEKIPGKCGDVIPNGCLSSSGYGDGQYDVSVGYKEGTDDVLYLKIHFIEESDEESDESW